MGTGSKIRLVPSAVSWNPQLAHDRSATVFPELSMVLPRPDPRLLHIWADLREFSRVANDATNSGATISAVVFSRLSTSVPNRLVNLTFDPTSLPELLRLCMLSYAKSLLIRLPGLGKKMTFLSERLEMALRAQLSMAKPEQSMLLLWALFITTLSIFEGLDAGWLRTGLAQTLSSLSLRTWAEIRGVVKGFLWMDRLHDHPAEQLVAQLHKRSIEVA